ncbi:hypothetical protein KY329_04790 [Candidatus Woesearchaeota archaeon]|nr:hypothetical protein [Candidatus Woesearchaeota archaeon]
MKWPTTATIISIITALILILIAMGIFNQPDVVDVRQTGQSVCPSIVTKTFDITFKNIGNNDAKVYVLVKSDSVEFTKAEDMIVVPPSVEPSIISFDIKNKQFQPRETFVDYEWHSKRFWLFKQSGKERCVYKRDATSPSTLNLVKI